MKVTFDLEVNDDLIEIINDLDVEIDNVKNEMNDLMEIFEGENIAPANILGKGVRKIIFKELNNISKEAHANIDKNILLAPIMLGCIQNITSMVGWISFKQLSNKDQSNIFLFLSSALRSCNDMDPVKGLMLAGMLYKVTLNDLTKLKDIAKKFAKQLKQESENE